MLIRLLRGQLRSYSRPLLAVVLLQFVGTMASLYLPSLNADIIDQGVARGDTDYIVQRAVTVLGSGAVGEVSTWRQARAEAQGDNRLLGQVLALFGLGALVAAGLAVHGAIATRIRGHLPNLLAVNFYKEGDVFKVADELNGVRAP